jgi:hypothetical protein
MHVIRAAKPVATAPRRTAGARNASTNTRTARPANYTPQVNVGIGTRKSEPGWSAPADCRSQEVGQCLVDDVHGKGAHEQEPTPHVANGSGLARQSREQKQVIHDLPRPADAVSRFRVSRARQRQVAQNGRARRLHSVVRPIALRLASFVCPMNVPRVRATRLKLPLSARLAKGRPLHDRAPSTCHGAPVPVASGCPLPARRDLGRAKSNRTACFGPRHLAQRHERAGPRMRGSECDRWQCASDRSSCRRLLQRRPRSGRPFDNAESRQ